MAGAPRGCGPDLHPIYYDLCDLTTAWGVVAEAAAAAGVVTSCALLVVLAASMPRVTDEKRKGTVALQAGVLIFTLGLFGLAFAFVVGRHPVGCAARRFLFGVLFAGCLSCLAMHGSWLVLLQRQQRWPRSWMLCLGALVLWLVEVIINAEWLIITVVRSPPMAGVADVSCDIANQDFVMSLIYVMVLLLAVALIPLPLLTHKHKQWRRDGAFIWATGLCTAAIWVAWIVMYIHWNRLAGHPSWDDPTLAVALVSNAWAFLLLYTIPEICLVTREEPYRERPHHGDNFYPPWGLVYGNIVAPHRNVHVAKDALSLDEPATASPWGAGGGGPPRSPVYRLTELALIAAKGPPEVDRDEGIAQARGTSPHPGSSSALSRS